MTDSKLFVAALIGLSAACSSDCALDDDIRLFAGETAHDCGSVPPGGDRADVDACVAEAFDAGEPFIARYERAEAEANVVSALASNTEGKVKLFGWSSASCGGAGCDAATEVQICDGPALSRETSEDPLALPITCERVGLPQRVCG